MRLQVRSIIRVRMIQVTIIQVSMMQARSLAGYPAHSRAALSPGWSIVLS